MNEILFWGWSLNAWITLVPADNPNIGKTLGEAGLFHVKGGNLIEIYHSADANHHLHRHCRRLPYIPADAFAVNEFRDAVYSG